MLRRLIRLSPVALLLALAGWAGYARLQPPKPLDDAAFAALYATPLPPPAGPLRVFHLGHSLVGRDMPAMLAQLAPEGAGYELQLGWGTSLKEHWQGPAAIRGFESENATPRFRPAGEALDSGAYDAVVLTEMVELADAIRWHDSPEYLARWAARARAARPDVRLFLYETWHHLDDPRGWAERIAADLPALWEGVILRGALARAPEAGPIHLIPAGQALAAFARAVEAQGGVGNIASRADLFARKPDGARDTIHLNDMGAYLVALTHYAVLYQRSPEGLPHALRRADGTPAEAPSPEAARLMQRIVWEVVRGNPLTGLPRPGV
jgi:hypothetical protein